MKKIGAISRDFKIRLQTSSERMKNGQSRPTCCVGLWD